MTIERDPALADLDEEAEQERLLVVHRADVNRLLRACGGIPGGGLGYTGPDRDSKAPPSLSDAVDQLEAYLRSNREVVGSLSDDRTRLHALQSDVAAFRRILGTDT